MEEVKYLQRTSVRVQVLLYPMLLYLVADLTWLCPLGHSVCTFDMYFPLLQIHREPKGSCKYLYLFGIVIDGKQA